MLKAKVSSTYIDTSKEGRLLRKMENQRIKFMNCTSYSKEEFGR